MMRKLFFLAIISTLFFACGSNHSDQPASEVDSLTEAPFYWQTYLDDSTGKIGYRKLPADEKLNPHNVLFYLNKNNPNIRLELKYVSADTIFLRIQDAVYLTQQMGSSGPMIYLSEVVYNFSEIPGIKEVDIEFEEGDHATPGTYNRNSFTKE